jgi:cytoskeletal protein CcmA (bactofilin family)
MQNPKVPNADKRTVVEEGTLLDGSLVSSCAIVVNGEIRGEVTAPSLQVNGTGSVKGKAKVDQIVSAGELSGDFEADLVQLAGVVRDGTILRANSLEVHLAASDRGTVVFGNCSLEVGEMPDKEAAVRASLGDSAPSAKPGTVADDPSPPTAADPDSLPDAEGRTSSKRKTATARRQ